MTQEFEVGLQEKLEELESYILKLIDSVQLLKQENASLKRELDEKHEALVSLEKMQREIGALRDTKTRATRKIETLIQRLDRLTLDS